METRTNNNPDSKKESEVRTLKRVRSSGSQSVPADLNKLGNLPVINILIAEDEDIQFLIAKRVWKQLGEIKKVSFNIVRKMNGEAALKELNNNPYKYQIVVCDDVMPGIHGHEIIPKMANIYTQKDKEKDTQRPLIFLCSSTFKETVEGSDGSLEKSPINLNNLLSNEKITLRIKIHISTSPQSKRRNLDRRDSNSGFSLFSVNESLTSILEDTDNKEKENTVQPVVPAKNPQSSS